MSLIAKLMLIFTLIPILEISLLIPLHSAIGGWSTVGLVCCTALLGTILVRWQGSLALNRIKEAIGEGKIPSDEIIDGILVLVAGTTLITPGILTDTTGLLLLVPMLRKPVRNFIKKRFNRWLMDSATSGSVSYSQYGDPLGGQGYEYDYGSPETAAEPPQVGASESDYIEQEPEPVPVRSNLGKPDAIL